MSKEDLTERQKALHQSDLARYQLLYNAPLHSDKIAADIGIFAIKVVLTINGAGLVGLVTLLTQLRSQSSGVEIIQGPAKLLFFGLMASALSAGIAYFYQSLVTANDWNEFHKAYPARPDAKEPHPKAGFLSGLLAIPMILFVAAAYVLFGLAAWDLIDTIPGLFRHTESTPNGI